MDVVRTRILLAGGAALGIAALLSYASTRPATGTSASRSLDRAASYFDSTVVLARGSAPRGLRGDELTIALGYLERLRLGLGSPFRLVDEASRDPRLGPPMSRRVSLALLARLGRGDAYAIDGLVLDGGGPWGPDGRGATGREHLALIEHAIDAAPDARAGELAVRLAYSIAAAKGSIAPATVAAATQAAALVRDRVLARADLQALLSDATANQVDVLDLVAQRRASRSLRVELPPLAPISATLQVEAMNAAPALVRRLDTLDRVDTARARGDVIAAEQTSSSLLGRAFAARLADLSRTRPPVAPIVVTMRSRAGSQVRASNEEGLVAGHALAGVRSDSVRRIDAQAMLSSAVAMRALAQQTPWFPGDEGPDAADIASEFGIADVTFARAVPWAWRPFYLRELQGGLRDLRRALPAFAAAGLHVHFNVEPLRDSALAMHDPRTRTLQLSISTSGGTLAHELAHDLDWQTARRLFATGGGYSTDRSAREQRGALARSVRGLAEARLLRPSAPSAPGAPGAPGAPSAPGASGAVDRPAELFARGADWFVASSLAQQGVTNGFLSAIEDASLGGYAAGLPTAVGAAGAQSLISAMDAMTYVPDSIRAAFRSQWSDSRIVDPSLLVRRALETPVSWRGVWRAQGPLGWPAQPAEPQLCSGDASAASRARERLLMMAIDARARGTVERRARYRPAATRPDWANSVLGVAPWAADDGNRVVGRLRAAIASELTTALSDQGVVPAVPAIFRSSAASCSPIAR